MTGYEGRNWLMGGEYDANADWLADFNRRNGYAPSNRDMNAGRSNAFYDLLTGGRGLDPSTYYGRSSQDRSQMNDLYTAFRNSMGRSGEDNTRALMGYLPGLES